MKSNISLLLTLLYCAFVVSGIVYLIEWRGWSCWTFSLLIICIPKVTVKECPTE